MIENVSTQLTVFHCLCPLPASRKGLRLPLRSALFGEGGRDWRPCRGLFECLGIQLFSLEIYSERQYLSQDDITAESLYLSQVASIKETRSVTMNIFRKKYFLFKSFVKIELSYKFAINMFSTAKNCMEKRIIL